MPFIKNIFHTDKVMNRYKWFSTHRLYNITRKIYHFAWCSVLTLFYFIVLYFIFIDLFSFLFIFLAFLLNDLCMHKLLLNFFVIHAKIMNNVMYYFN